MPNSRVPSRRSLKKPDVVYAEAYLVMSDDGSGRPSEQQLDSFVERFRGGETCYPWEHTDSRHQNAVWVMGIVAERMYANLRTNPHVTAAEYGLRDLKSATEKITHVRSRYLERDPGLTLDWDVIRTEVALLSMGLEESDHNFDWKIGRTMVNAIARECVTSAVDLGLMSRPQIKSKPRPNH